MTLPAGLGSVASGGGTAKAAKARRSASMFAPTSRLAGRPLYSGSSKSGAVSTVAATLILFLAFPRWAEKALARLKTWLTKHSRVILLIVFGLMGLLFAVEGVLALLG